MSCTLAAIAACFSLSHLYFDVGAQTDRELTGATTESFYGQDLYVMPENGNPPFLQRNLVREISPEQHTVVNPYVSLGYEWNPSNFRIELGGFYQQAEDSYAGASLRVRWFPFRRE